jgi:Lrp/AsnC family transcriptional regulator, leucine-responsive regulatory protein
MHQRLDFTDKTILFELDRNCRISDTELAKKTSKSKEAIRYRINRLKKSKIINRFYIWIDPLKLGYNSYKIYLKLKNTPDRKQELINMLKSEKKIMWLGLADGAWDLGATFFAKDNKDFYELQNKITANFGDLILKKDTGILVDVMISSKDFLIDKPNTSIQTVFNKKENIEIDETDKALLVALQKNARANFVELAFSSGLTIDIVRYRLKRLVEKGIIIMFKAEIAFDKLEFEFFKTFLYTQNLSKTKENELITYFKNHPNILHMVRQISPWDIELEIMVKSYSEYNRIINDIKEKFSDTIKDVESATMSEDYTYPSKKLIFE